MKHRKTKTIIKYSLMAAALLAAAMMLCSCKALDDLKWNHAVYTEKGNKNSIEFRGKTYELFDSELVYENVKNDLSLILDHVKTGNLTDPDVPVLLSVIRGEPLFFNQSDDETPLFLAVDYDYIADEGRTKFYCLKDESSEFEKMIKEAKMDHLFLTQETWIGEEDAYEMKKSLLDDAATDAILRTINRQYNEKTDCENWRQITDLSPKYLQPLFCDKNMIFTDARSVQIVRTKGDHHTYYIGLAKDPYAAWSDDNGAFKDAWWKQVSEEDAKIIEPLFTKYEGSVEMFYFEEDEETF